MINKKELSEEDIKRIYITPAIDKAGWEPKKQVRQEIYFTAGRIIIHGKTIIDGWVRHYSKAISVKKYEEDCDYYIKSIPMLAEKWRQRKGKAIKKDYKSDFGTSLYEWEEAKEKSIKI